MKRLLYLLLALSFCINFIGCRKAPNRGRISHVPTTTTKEPERKQTNRERKQRTIKRNDTPLTGSDIFKRYEEAVFMIFTSDGINNYQGSGFFIGNNGLAVSNYHVFQGTTIGKEHIKLAKDNENLYKVIDIVYKSKEPDFIIFHVDYNNVNYIPIAKNKPCIGDKVFAIGSPRGLENTFSSGEISQWRGENLMQISALIDHGSSGGALINEYGEAVGITSGSFADGSQANLNYAWSIDAIKPFLHKH